MYVFIFLSTNRAIVIQEISNLGWIFIPIFNVYVLTSDVVKFTKKSLKFFVNVYIFSLIYLQKIIVINFKSLTRRINEKNVLYLRVRIILIYKFPLIFMVTSLKYFSLNLLYSMLATL